MDSNIVSHVLQYAGILIEAALVLYLAWTSQWKAEGGVGLYVTSLLFAQLTRAYVLRSYGLTSLPYFYVYWSTDFLLVSSAFLLLWLFFRRACRDEEDKWRLVRLLLVFVFVLVVGISGLTLSRNYSHLFPYFVYEFNQNLYFACLVLNTLLYLLLQYIDSIDEQLGLLVCGVGIQFAGPAATLALVHLTAGERERFAQSFGSFIMRLCTLGMLLVWAYAIVHVKEKAIKVTRREIPVLAEVTANSNV
jgi:hypothetical protein